MWFDIPKTTNRPTLVCKPMSIKYEFVQYIPYLKYIVWFLFFLIFIQNTYIDIYYMYIIFKQINLPDPIKPRLLYNNLVMNQLAY